MNNYTEEALNSFEASSFLLTLLFITLHDNQLVCF